MACIAIAARDDSAASPELPAGAAQLPGIMSTLIGLENNYELILLFIGLLSLGKVLQFVAKQVSASPDSHELLATALD